MVKVWLCKDGRNPTSSEEPFATVPLAECVNKLRVTNGDFLSDLDRPPHFGRGDHFSGFAGLGTLLEIDVSEAAAAGWKPGFYRAHISVNEAMKILKR